MTPQTDDAQRELERRALRNVRGLLDRMEESDEADARTQRRLLVAILVGAVAVAAFIAWAVVGLPRGGETVTLPAPKPPGSAPAR